MSAIIAMIYHGEICLASDTKVTDHETGQETGSEVKQITINDKIAIGFAGSGNIAQVIMNTLANPENTHIVSKLVFIEIPAVLNDIYQTHIAENQYPDEEASHVSALIIGINGSTPEIVRWDSTGETRTIRQSDSNKFTASILQPYAMDLAVCNEILWESAKKNSQCGSLKDIATDYFNIVASKSKFTSATATIWTHSTLGIIDNG